MMLTVERPSFAQGRLGGCPHMSISGSGRADAGSQLYFVHWSTQSFTVLYQSREFCGFSTQWPSSGK